MTDLEWGEPPPMRTSRRCGTTQVFVDALKERPGEWAKYPFTVSSITSASSYRRNHPGTEWTGRSREDGRCDMYARWVGGVS